MKPLNTARLKTLTTLFFFLSAGSVFAKPVSHLDLKLGLGHRIDHLDWSISGDINGNNPNILSELIWDDLNITQVKGSGILSIGFVGPFSLYMRSDIAYGLIYKGNNQDSDYAGNNRTFEFSRSNNSSDDGSVIDASFGLGVQFKKEFKKPGIRIGVVPLVGYAYHAQNLKMRNGVQTVSRPEIFSGVGPLGAIPNLNSTYETEWDGPWVGIDFSYSKNNTKKNPFNSHFNARFEYHFTNYHAEADWNLRESFAHPKSFEHNADGRGLLMSFGWSLPLWSGWSSSLTVDFQKWSTDPGTDRTFLSDGTSEITRLNEVNWDSRAVILGLQYRFL